MAVPRWLENLRRTEIVEAVRGHAATVDGHLMGIPDNEVFNQVIGGGQADFSEPYLHLAPLDRALLYAYFNQKGHIEELCEAFTQLFGQRPPADPLVVVDLGCGPFTGGLVLAAILGSQIPFTYIGLDRAVAMHELGERLAMAAESRGEMSCLGRHWVKDFADLRWPEPPKWRPVLVIASYLLASPTLDANLIVEQVDHVCRQLGRGPVTVLYTNAVGSHANRSFGVFRCALEAAGFAIIADDQGAIESRGYTFKERKLRYALFHRDAQRTLEV